MGNRALLSKSHELPTFICNIVYLQGEEFEKMQCGFNFPENRIKETLYSRGRLQVSVHQAQSRSAFVQGVRK